jgi:hypothetical protein
MDVVRVDASREDPTYSRELCERLESGDVLRLANTPFQPSPDDAALLRSQKQTGKSFHKNIAYKPNRDRTTGLDGADSAVAERMNAILGAYSRGALQHLARLLRDYAGKWQVDYASFRPVEEEGRDLPLRHRNDLMHLDAFPTRPTNGGRILRMFTNLNPDRPRVWATSDSFEEIAGRYAGPAGLRRAGGSLFSAQAVFGRAARLIGLRVPDRSPYDTFMLGFHHYLKGNEEFQKTGRSHTIDFLPGESWIAFTDQVAHAVLSGQYALEQTCIVPYEAMVLPDRSPVAVLERLAGRPLRNARAGVEVIHP